MQFLGNSYTNDTAGIIDSEVTIDTEDDDEEGGEEEIVSDDESDNYFACETKLDIFVLQQDLFITGNFHGEINRPSQR